MKKFSTNNNHIRALLLKLKSILQNRTLRIFIFISALTHILGLETNASQRFIPLSSDTLKKQGNYLLYNNQYIDALAIYVEAMEHANKEGNLKTAAECLNNIGTIYAVFKDNETSELYFQKAFNIAQSLNDNRLLSISSSNLVAINADLGKPTEVARYAHVMDSLNYSPQKSEYFREYNTAKLYEAKKDYVQAIPHYRNAYKINQKDSLNSGQVLFQALAKCFKHISQPDSALKYYKYVVRMSVEGNNYEETADAYLDIANLHNLNHEIDSVAKYQNAYISLSDSLFNIRNYNTAKSRLDTYERQQREMQLTKQRLWIFTFASIAIIMAICLCISLYYYKKLNTARKILVRTNEELLHQRQKDYVKINEDMANSADSDLSTADSRKLRLIKEIRQAMNDRDLICNPDFSLQMLTEKLNSNTKYVSTALNEEFSMSFKSLLNELRIKEVCSMMMDNERYGNYTIAAIAQLAGYNSMNNFITAFKKTMGMTPSKYRELSRATRKDSENDEATTL